MTFVRSVLNPPAISPLVEFEAEGKAVADLEVSFKRDERVIRFLTVKMEKDHLAYAEKRRAKRGQKSTVPAEA